MTEYRGSWALLLVSALCALAHQEFFYGAQGLGINVGLAFLVLLIAGFALVRMGHLSVKRATVFGLLPIAIGALGVSLNDSRGLDFLNFLLIAEGIGWIAFVELGERKPDWMASLILAPLYSLMIPFVGLAHLIEGKWSRETPGVKGPQLAILKGGALAAPVMLLFGGILAQADPVFGKIVNPFAQIQAEAVFTRSMLWLFFAMCSFSIYSVLAGPVKERFNKMMHSARIDPPPVATEKKNDHAIVATTFLGLLALLFGLFVVVQLRYLFGGEAVLKEQQMTYADYARRGFFEISAVVGLMIPMLLGIQRLMKSDANLRGFKVAGLVISSLLIALLASAGYRMWLYVDAYGLSPLRVYVVAAIVWMALILALYMGFALRWRLTAFSYATLTAAFAVAAGLNAVRPDLLIARYNLSKTGRVVDGQMLTESGADAAPALLGTPYEAKWRETLAGGSTNFYSRSRSEMLVGR